MVPYDEFGLFHENAAEYGIAYEGPPEVRRVGVEVAPGRTLSSLVWGSATPELVLVHGGAQNAHTWDTVALALGRPLLAVDLPGHGHSDGGADGSLSLAGNGRDLAAVVAELAPHARGVVGMSLGGVSSIALASHAPELVRALVLVDVTPGVNEEKAAPITNFVNGPASFDSFDELLARTIEHNPGRTESSLRRGILHNAVQREDGTWVWRYARFRADGASVPEFGGWWEADLGAQRAGHARAGTGLVRRRRRGRRRAASPPTGDPRGGGRRGRPQRAGRPTARAGGAHRGLPLRLGRGRKLMESGSDGATAAARRSAAEVWLSRRALTLHAVVLVVVPGFMALCIWQLHRALDGNELSWAYVFEWPFFTGYAIYLWWRLVHERPRDGCRNPGGRRRVRSRSRVMAPEGSDRSEDPELAAYNEYLARLAERDRAAGR